MFTAKPPAMEAFCMEGKMSIDELMTYLVTPVAQVLLIIGLAEVIKRMNVMPSKFIPLADLAMGIVFSIAVYWSYGIVNAVLAGIAIGLSACGLFSGIKNVTQPQWTFSEDANEMIEDGEVYEDEDNTAKE